MSSPLRTFFDHSRQKLWGRDVDPLLDVLAFQGEEILSQPFTYRMDFTCTQHDLAADQLLGRAASFSLHGAPQKLGGYIRITPSAEIQSPGPGLISIKGQHRLKPPASEEFPLPELPGSGCKECLKRARSEVQGFVLREVQA